MAEDPTPLVEEPVAVEPIISSVDAVVEALPPVIEVPITIETPEPAPQKGIMDIIKNVLDTMDSASLITYTVVVFGCAMMLISLILVPDMFVLVAAISLALIGAFTGVHIGVKSALNTAGLAPVQEILTQLPAVFVEAIPMAIEMLTKISEANNVAHTPAPPSQYTSRFELNRIGYRCNTDYSNSC